MNMFEEAPIINVWFDEKLRNPTTMPVTLDTLLQIFVDEYGISPEEINALANPPKVRTRFVTMPGLPGKPTTVYSEIRKRN